MLFAHSDGRLFFVVPWLGYSLLGTTDTDYHGDPTAAAADAEDVDYLLDKMDQLSRESRKGAAKASA